SLAVGTVLATNLVNSEVLARIRSTSDVLRAVAAGGEIVVSATGEAQVFANTKLSAVSSSTNMAGLSLVATAIAEQGGVDFTDRSGSRFVASGDLVRIDDFDHSTYDVVPSLAAGARIRIEFDGPGVAAGDVFEYVGVEDLTSPEGIELDRQDFTDATRWRKLLAAAGEIYRFVGSPSQRNLATENFLNTSNWAPLASLNPTDAIPGLSLNISNSNSASFGGLVVRNEVRDRVIAELLNTTATAVGSISVVADERTGIEAQNVSTVTSSGGSAWGSGLSLAVNGMIVTNAVLSEAESTVTGGSLTAGGLGKVSVVAENDSRAVVSNLSTTEANGYAIGVTLAFNSIGFLPSNILFNSVDALVGTNLASPTPAEAIARVAGATVTAGAGIEVMADNRSLIDSRIRNAGVAISVTPAGGSTTVNVGAIIAMNRVAANAHADLGVNDIARPGTGDLVVAASDNSQVQADVRQSSVSIGVGLGSSSGVAVGVTWARNEVDNNALATLTDAGTQAAPMTLAEGDLIVRVSRQGAIEADARTTTIGVAAGLGSGVGVSGGGTVAINQLTGSAKSAIRSSVIRVLAGEVAVTSENDASIGARVHTVSGALTIGTGSSPAFGIGMSVAVNNIGWRQVSAAHHHTNRTQPATLATGQTVKIEAGPLYGNVYRYLGTTTSVAAEIRLGEENYQDTSRWELISLQAAEHATAAQIDGSLVDASGPLTVTSRGTSQIDAEVMAGAVAVGAGLGSGFAVSIGGAISLNRIASGVLAEIANSPAIQAGALVTRIAASAIQVRAEDASSITAVTGAAALAASLAGGSAIAGSIGLSIAENRITGGAKALITAAGSVESKSGGLDVVAITRAVPLLEINLASRGLTVEMLDDASRQDDDNGSTAGVNEQSIDVDADAIILDKIATAATAGGIELPLVDTLLGGWTFGSAQGAVELKVGQSVKLKGAYRP
ncbi:MAG: hypothetical protein EHM77_02370, partial [Planctomycetaceae bacterium]